MVMHNRIRIQQECIEHICDILGPDVYESYEGSGHRTRLQQAILETQQRIYPSLIKIFVIFCNLGNQRIRLQ